MNIKNQKQLKNHVLIFFFTSYLTVNLKYCISYFTYHKPNFGKIKFDE